MRSPCYVADLLREQLTLDVPQDRILPVSAKRAILARQVLTGAASPQVLEDFALKAHGDLAEPKDMTLERCRLDAPRLLERSGVLRFEERVLAHLYRERGRLLLEGLLGELDHHMVVLANYLAAARKALTNDQEKLKQKVADLNCQLKQVNVQLGQLGKLTRQSCSDLEGWVRGEFNRFSGEVDSKIDDALAEKPAHGFFRWALNQVVGLVKEVKDAQNDPAVARQKAEELNRSVSVYLAAEFEDFLVHLEREGHVQQKALFNAVEQAVGPLMRQVEQKVGAALDIELTPVCVHLPRPNLEEFRAGVTRDLKTFVRSSQRDQEYTDYDQRWEPGWFPCTGSYKTVPFTRTQKVTEYTVALEAVRKYWQEEVRARTETSVEAARKVVVSEVERALGRARDDVQGYANGYLQLIDREMQEARLGEEKKRQRLEEIDQRIEQNRTARIDVEKCQEYLRRGEPT